MNDFTSSDLTSTDTFNGKPVWRNIIAVILGVVGIWFLAQAWVYHMLVQLVTVPREDWIEPLADEHLPEEKEYPNAFCSTMCKLEMIMIHQLDLMRKGYGKEYCNEEDTDAT